MELQLQSQLIQPAMKRACLILDRLFAAGFSAYFVGGAVRDTLLERPIHDIDIATSALPEQVMAIFEHCIPTGLQHGTVTVVVDGIHYEVTTFRTEGEYEDHRRPTSVHFVTELELDLKRRDFTMNAMAIDRSFNLFDPFMGREHLSQRLLMTVGESKERFDEDALRMLRAVRFAATYNLTIEQKCQEAIQAYGYKLRHIAMERVAYELERLLEANNKVNAIQILLDSQLLKHCKASLHLANKTIQLDRTTQLLFNKSDSWLYLFAMAGMSGEEAVSDMNELRLSKAIIRNTKDILELVTWFEALTDMEREAQGSEAHINNMKTQWLHKLISYPKQAISSFFAQYRSMHPYYELLMQFHQQLPITHPNQLAVSGKDLVKWKNIKAGPWVKEQLDLLFIKVALGQLHNDKRQIMNSLQ